MTNSRPFLDFKSIKARVGILDILARYHVNLVTVNQTAQKGNCPLPSHSSGSEHFFFKQREVGLVLPFRFLQEKRPAGWR